MPFSMTPSSSPTGMSRATLISRAQDVLEEGVGSHLDSAKWIALANQAHKFVAKDVNGYWDSSTILSVDGLGVISLPYECLNILEVTYDGKRLTYASNDELSAFGNGWRDVEGTPLYYYVTGVGQSLVLYPKPDADNKEIKIYGTHIPVDFTGDSDTVRIPAPYDELVVNRLVIFAAKANLSDPTVLQKMAIAESEYNRMSRELRARTVWPGERRAIKGSRHISLPSTQRTVII